MCNRPRMVKKWFCTKPLPTSGAPGGRSVRALHRSSSDASCAARRRSSGHPGPLLAPGPRRHDPVALTFGPGRFGRLRWLRPGRFDRDPGRRRPGRIVGHPDHIFPGQRRNFDCLPRQFTSFGQLSSADRHPAGRHGPHRQRGPVDRFGSAPGQQLRSNGQRPGPGQQLVIPARCLGPNRQLSRRSQLGPGAGQCLGPDSHLDSGAHLGCGSLDRRLGPGLAGGPGQPGSARSDPGKFNPGPRQFGPGNQFGPGDEFHPGRLAFAGPVGQLGPVGDQPDPDRRPSGRRLRRPLGRDRGRADRRYELQAGRPGAGSGRHSAGRRQPE